jgi:hypothetical protein
MFKISIKAKILSLLASLMIVTVIGCGADSVDTDSQSEPVAQQPTAAATATSAPAPTSTPAPTVAPTATPAPRPTSTPTPGYSTEGLTPIDMPTELVYTSDPLDAEDVEAFWTSTISNARHYIMDGAIVVDTCADGTGLYLQEAARTGLSFTWEVIQDPGGRWSAARAHVTFSDPEIGKGPDGATAIPLIINKDGGRDWPTYSKTHEALTFVSPDCS